jgi:hypothetical protein
LCIESACEGSPKGAEKALWGPDGASLQGLVE